MKIRKGAHVKFNRGRRLHTGTVAKDRPRGGLFTVVDDYGRKHFVHPRYVRPL